MGKKGSILNEMIMQLILMAVITLVFFMAVSGQATARGVKQQVLEKELALLLDSARPGSSFEISKRNFGGVINEIKYRNGRIFVTVNGLVSVKGYPVHSRFEINVREEGGRFVLEVK